MKKLIAAALASIALCAHADGMQALEAFVKTARTGRAEFTQVVTAPARQGQQARTRTSTGSFEFSRPNRFRFEYRKPFAQTIVADGRTLWLHDLHLNQVTTRPQAQVLGATPAAGAQPATPTQAAPAEAQPQPARAEWRPGDTEY